MSSMHLLLLGTTCLWLTGIAPRPPDSENAVSMVLQPTYLTPTWVLQHAKTDDNDTSTQASVLLESLEKQNEPEPTGDSAQPSEAPPPSKESGEQPAEHTTQGFVNPMVDFRPDEGEKPDVVQFGIVLNKMYSVSMRDGSYTADLILNLRWEDDRVKNLPFKGKHITVSEESAQSMLWMPSIVISNSDIRGVDVLSSAVTIYKTGKVLKVQRVFASLKNKFLAADYPFDTQTFEVTIASATYMAEDLVLESIGECSKVQDVACSQIVDDALAGKGFGLRDVKSEAFEEVTGVLRKSRGRLSVVAERSPQKFYDSILWPAVFMSIVSYQVFWFPLSAPFVMPRTATAMICYLAMGSLGQRYATMAGGTYQTSLGDTYLVWLNEMMLATVFLNVAMEFIAHEWQEAEFAANLNHEMKVLYPVIFMATYVQVGAGYGYSQYCVLLICAAYVISSVLRLTWMKQQNVSAQEKEAGNEVQTSSQ